MAGNRRSEDAGEVPWPALVDLLTSVLIAFMFFILITTVAMSTMTLKTAEDIAKKKEQAQKVSKTDVVSDTEGTAMAANTTTAEVTSTILPPPAAVAGHTVNSEDTVSEKENQRLKDENEILKQQLAAMGASFAKSKEIKMVDEKADDALTLLFNPNEAGATPEVESRIAVWVKDMPATMQFQLTAAEPGGTSFSQGRERALTRAMVIRNVLLENHIDPARIRFEYDTKERYKSLNWVRIQAVNTPSTGARP